MKATLPAGNPTASYWQTGAHPDQVAKPTEVFVHEADTVIIGSGISGTLIAHNLLERDHGNNGKRLAMLEARNFCGGATGRNGGHIKPDCYRGFIDMAEIHGSDVARQQCEMESANRDEFSQSIRDHGLAEMVDLVDLRSADCFMSEEAWDRGLASYHAFAQAGGDVSRLEVLGAERVKKELRVENCKGAITFPACTLWPFKVVHGFLSKCIRKGLLAYEHTPALEISRSSTGRWQIATPRGAIHCNRVIHATNGYAAHLLPELEGRLIPLKGHAVAVKPGPTYAARPLTHSFAFHWGEDFDYMMQRPTDGKTLIFGGCDLAHPDGLIGGVGDSDDSTMEAEVVKALASSAKTILNSWDGDGGLLQAWSGVMCWTPDELPFAGEIPSRPGQYVVGGYSGHGMARAFLTTQAFCQLLYGETVDPRVPRAYFEIERRLREAIPRWDNFLRQASVGRTASAR